MKFAGTPALWGGREAGRGEQGSGRLSATGEGPAGAGESRRRGAPALPLGDSLQALEGFLKAAAYANIIWGSEVAVPTSQLAVPARLESKDGKRPSCKEGFPLRWPYRKMRVCTHTLNLNK